MKCHNCSYPTPAGESCAAVARLFARCSGRENLRPPMNDRAAITRIQAAARYKGTGFLQKGVMQAEPRALPEPCALP